MGGTRIEVQPAATVAALNGAMLAGQDMEVLATDVEGHGDALSSALTGAPTAAAAFSSFWDRYRSLPFRAAATVLHQASCVGRATAEIVSMDESMDRSVAGEASTDGLSAILGDGGR